MGGNEIVLGLLIERPGTSSELEQRVSERFGSAQFSRGTASQAMKRLAGLGLLRVDRRSGSYVPTRAGIEHFRRWIRSSISRPPVREELHAKIALCEPDELPALIEIVREAEKDCVVKLQGIQWRMQDENRGIATRDWKHRRDLIARSSDVAWWGGRIKWLQKVRIDLEKERRQQLDEAERPRAR